MSAKQPHQQQAPVYAKRKNDSLQNLIQTSVNDHYIDRFVFDRSFGYIFVPLNFPSS